jgi:hypothetical protein
MMSTAAGEATRTRKEREAAGAHQSCYLGVVPHAIMLDIDEALRLHLGL